MCVNIEKLIHLLVCLEKARTQAFSPRERENMSMCCVSLVSKVGAVRAGTFSSTVSGAHSWRWTVRLYFYSCIVFCMECFTFWFITRFRLRSLTVVGDSFFDASYFCGISQVPWATTFSGESVRTASHFLFGHDKDVVTKIRGKFQLVRFSCYFSTEGTRVQKAASDVLSSHTCVVWMQTNSSWRHTTSSIQVQDTCKAAA
jgi:hypothetical protein